MRIGRRIIDDRLAIDSEDGSREPWFVLCFGDGTAEWSSDLEVATFPITEEELVKVLSKVCFGEDL